MAPSSLSKLTRKATKSRGKKTLVNVRKQTGQKWLLVVPISVSVGSCLVFGLFRYIMLVDCGVLQELSDFSHILSAVLSLGRVRNDKALLISLEILRADFAAM